MKIKLYINPPVKSSEGVYELICENGEVVSSHYCSNSGFAIHDLVDEEELKNKYGQFEVLFLGDNEMTKQELIRRNYQFTNSDKKCSLDFKESVEKNNLTKWMIEEYSSEGNQMYFLFEEGKVYGCFDNQHVETNFEAVADYYNRQTYPDVIKKYDEFWKFKQ